MVSKTRMEITSTKERTLKEGSIAMVCTYQKENGKLPCCTHDCDGCIWHEEYEQYLKKHDCSKCPTWSGTDCTRNPYEDGCLDPVVEEYWKEHQ